MDDQQLLESASKEQLQDLVAIWTEVPAALRHRPEPGDDEVLARVDRWRLATIQVALAKGITRSMLPGEIQIDQDLIKALRENRCNILGGFTPA
ncbi:hypothetical protein CH249_15395 [Rhodococcus sp. 05-2255-3B1]|uniref:hypothetical protein n=1 Tax=unclassified Rhodococcus (in: high G+C Gram-positive bacteria) TaxID=192944 RepID=UPI000B9BEC0C|nr:MULTISPECIES: hypothetical protein [unclassified Rhodococcus (in: high G+C Gram-positive bacteria)]OZE03175.1 hypothetical protein CH250_23460 [Rhodococcus sp. 05-2255-3C]OZE09564.1 hypothetical protein CH249_15395 [Rhodococcus sp. 05-2255-3B1]OZE14830.1 hypothetical protein CH255_21740 [Rhodococcus sp. 05-2255-2A2]